MTDEEAVEAYQRASEEMFECDFTAAKPALQFLLTRIGSWTSARWDQHLRNEFGDEKAERAIGMIERLYEISKYGQTRLSEVRGHSPQHDQKDSR
jgi:hypothetical protein